MTTTTSAPTPEADSVRRFRGRAPPSRCRRRRRDRACEGVPSRPAGEGREGAGGGVAAGPGVIWDRSQVSDGVEVTDYGSRPFQPQRGTGRPAATSAPGGE